MMIHRDWSDDDEDADLTALRQAALRTLPFHKRRLSRSSETDSSASSDTHDKDYRFENQKATLTTTHDIDERFPVDQDLLIVNCPNQIDDELLLSNVHRKTNEKKEDEDHRPVSITMKFHSKDFDLRQLIKKRRIDENTDDTSIEQRNIRVQNQRSHRN